MITPAPLLDVRDVSVRFGGVQALRGVSLQIRPGEAVGVVGPNGAGKTTLLRVVAGELRPSAGGVWFAGHPLGDLAAHERARLGIRRTFQRIEVFPELSVRDHLLVAERARRGDGRLWKDLLGRGRPRAAELDRVDRMLARMGLADRAETPVAALSLGHCRLVELARAMIAEPRLLLADEPSSGLDQAEGAAAARTLNVVRHSGATLLLVEHDLGLVTETVDRLVVLDFGELIADGPVADVLDDDQVRRAYLGTSTC